MEYVPPIGGDPGDPYVDADPGAGVEGSRVSAAAIEGPMREMHNAIEASGQTPDPGDYTQLAQALAGATSFWPGMIVMFGGPVAPAGWVFCDGAAISRTTFADLFAAIGTVWGIGDGATTFNVPNMRSRSPLGAGQSAGLSSRALGEYGGEESHVLTTGEMPAHTHTVTLRTDAGGGGAEGPDFAPASPSQGTVNTSSTGGGTAHNTMHPYAVVPFIIKT